MKYRHLLSLLVCISLLAGCAAGGEKQTPSQRQAESFRKLGEAYMGEKNYSLALAQFLRAEKMTPNDAILHQDLGITYMAKNEMETAVTHFKRALEIQPDYASARNNLGVVYMAMGNWDAAIETFKLLSRDLLYATPHYPLANLGKAYYEKKDYPQAEHYYREALNVEPGFVNALYGLGKTNQATGNIRKASEYFERAVQGAPQMPELHFDLAETYRLLGNLPKAREDYAKAVALSPPNSDLARKAKQALFDLK